jgi:hypothetical protein
LILRIQRHPDAPRSPFEKTALQVTGASFYLLAAGLLASGIFNAVFAHKPETALSGLVVSLVSIAVMSALVFLKTRVGRQLNSAPILADANCSFSGERLDHSRITNCQLPITIYHLLLLTPLPF